MAFKKTEVTEEVICIAEEFSEWLEDISEKYGWDKDDVQDLIKRFLSGINEKGGDVE